MGEEATHHRISHRDGRCHRASPRRRSSP
jgi:hypothetical protein